MFRSSSLKNNSTKSRGLIAKSLKARCCLSVVSISIIYPQTACKALSTRAADPVSSNGSRRSRWLKHIEATLLTCVFDTCFEFRYAAKALAARRSVNSPRSPSLPNSIQISAHNSRMLSEVFILLILFLAAIIFLQIFLSSFSQFFWKFSGP